MSKLEEYIKEAQELEQRKRDLEEKVTNGPIREELKKEATNHIESAKRIYELLQMQVAVKKNAQNEVVGYAFGDIDTVKPKNPKKNGTASSGGKGGGRGPSAEITDRLVKALTDNPDGLNQSELAKKAGTGPITVGKHILTYPEKFIIVPKGKRWIIKLAV